MVFPDYATTLDYLFSRLPMFSRIGKAALKPDLTNTLALCKAVDNPEADLKCIHVAGTNGKGSTSHGLAAVLQKAGYKTGLYTSPHLVDFRERIRIDGQPVSKQWVVNFVNTYHHIIEQINPSFFEITVAMAFRAFADYGVDVAVIETGLGGRLDSTNVIEPILSIITNISYDHKDLLGNTLSEIATEKAGIIKPHVPVIIGEQHEETERVFFEQSVLKQSSIYYVQSHWDMVRVKQDAQYQYFKAVDKTKQELYDLKTDLTGNYQYHNLKTILTASEVLNFKGLKLPLQVVLAALSEVKPTTGFMGRWDWLQTKPAVICDVAHNPAGLQEVLAQWQSVKANRKHIVIGFVKDKEVAEALAMFPKDAIYHFCNAQIPRALPVAELAEMAAQAGLSGDIYNSVTDAVSAAMQQLQEEDALLITGSFFIVGEAIAYVRKIGNEELA